jgi:hypothetical protein
MDNYFQQCPPMMDDGRGLTDFRSSQVREEIFRHKNCVLSENEARTLRIDNAEVIMDREWNGLRDTRSCYPRQNCYHQNPVTRVTTAYNNAEILAYNGELPAPRCNLDAYDYRATTSKGSRIGRIGSNKPISSMPYAGYPKDRCPARCAKTNRLKPERLNEYDQQ